jgi:3-deoxy-manno-octulosonate cytidylyltransferase (CMP-KDO synthetase)
MSAILDEVYVATCDDEIMNYIDSIGGKAIMTKNTHERASDRVAEATLKIEDAIGEKTDIIVLIQGDEPMIVPEMINDAVNPLIEDSTIGVSNLMAKIKSVDEFEDPNEVKVVVNENNFALYFSREPIPSRKKYDNQVPMFKQVCVIPFSRDYLLRFTTLEPTSLEIIESVDMNRFLEHGLKIKMVRTKYETYSVDTRKDLKKVKRLMKYDNIYSKYY